MTHGTPDGRRAVIGPLRGLGSPEGRAAPYATLAEPRATGDVVRAPWSG